MDIHIKHQLFSWWTEDTRVLISQINGISGVRAVFQGMCCTDSCGDGGFRRNSWSGNRFFVVKTTQNLPWNQVLTFEEDFGSVRICQNLSESARSSPWFSLLFQRIQASENWSFREVGEFFVSSRPRLVTLQDCFMWIFSFCYTIFCCLYVALFIANLNGKDHWHLGRSMLEKGFCCGSVDQPFWFLKSTLYTWYCIN